jgi:hypothetical protein
MEEQARAGGNKNAANGGNDFFSIMQATMTTIFSKAQETATSVGTTI